MKLKKAFYLVAVLVFLVIGAKNASAASCQTNEKCMPLTQKAAGSDTYYDPAGFKCTARGACPGQVGTDQYQECCASITSSTTNTTTNGSSAASAGPTSFINPLRFTSVEDFLTNGLLAAIQKIIVVIAVLFIAIGSLLYVTAGANPDNAEKGKEAITAALIGLAIALAGPSLLKDLGATIGWTSSVDVPNSVSTAPGIAEIALRVLNFILGTLGILALIMMVSGAGMYLTSAGNEDQIDKGKEIIKYSFLGVLIAMASMVLVTQIAQFFVR